MNNRHAEAVLERLLRAAGVQKYAELAKALGVKPQSISDAKTKNKVPVTWAVTIAVKYGVSVDWILFGQNPMKREKIFPDSEKSNAHSSDMCSSESQQRMLVSKVEELEKENLLLKEANNSHKDALWACKIAIQALQAKTEKKEKELSDYAQAPIHDPKTLTDCGSRIEKC